MTTMFQKQIQRQELEPEPQQQQYQVHQEHQDLDYHQKQDNQRRPSWFIVKLTFTASLGGTIFGYDLGAISGCLPQLIASEKFSLTPSESEWIVSILYVGGGVGAAIGGGICDVFGRKKTIILTDLVFMLGALILYSAQSIETIVFGRFIVGVGIAVSGVSDVSYLHECSPAEWRGAIVSCNEAAISFGFLLAYLAGYIYDDESKDDWRMIFGIAGIVASVQLLGMLSLPESPEWLIEKGRTQEAKDALAEIQGTTSTTESTTKTIAATTTTTIPPPASILNDRIINSESKLVYGTSSLQQLKAGDNQHRTNNDGSRQKKGLRKRKSEDEISIQDHLSQRSPPSSSVMGNVGPIISLINVDSSNDDDRHGYLIAGNYQQTADSSDGDLQASTQSPHNYFGWKDIRHRFQTIVSTVSRYRRQCSISLYLAIVQQFCGQTNVLSYAPLIFAAAVKQDVDSTSDAADSGIGESASGWTTVSIGLVKFVVTVLVICRIEQIGRRKLLLVGTSLIAIGLLLLTVAFGGSNRSAGNDHSDGTTNFDENSNSWSPITNIKTFHLALPGVLLVVTGYSMSFGPLTWLLTSELFPTDIRGRALGASTVITYLAAAIATRTFLSGQSWMGTSMLFGGYCIITSLGVIFEYLAIPDTGKMTAEQIDYKLSEMPWWKVAAVGQSKSSESHTLVQHPSSLEMGSQLSLNGIA